MGEKMNREYFESGAAAFNYNNVVWIDQKNLAQKAAVAAQRYAYGSSGEPSTAPKLSKLESMVISILGEGYGEPQTTGRVPAFDQTGGGGDSGGSGGSGMECIPVRSPPGPFHYLISEQAKSLVALQELQNEVGALLEFRDLVIETFPNLRSKMSPSTGSAARRSGSDWEPGVRVRRKLAAGDPARAKPQPSVQDSGFSTETSCGKDAHSSSASASAPSRSRPLEDELWALLDVIQRKGARLKDEAELLRSELDENPHDTAEESFARALSVTCGDCTDLRRLRTERDALLVRAAQLEAEAATAVVPSPAAPRTPLGRLDRALGTPSTPPLVATPDSKKIAAILQESNPVELQRQLLSSTVQNQLLAEKLRRAAGYRTLMLQRLEQTRDQNDDLRFRLEEKNIELEGARARVRQLEGGKQRAHSCGGAGGAGAAGGASLERSRSHSSMRDMEPLAMPDDVDDDDARISETPRRRPSRIPLHTAHKGAAPRAPPAPPAPPPRPPSSHSARSVASGRSRASGPPGSLAARAPGAPGSLAGRAAGAPGSLAGRKEARPGAAARRASQPHDSKCALAEYVRRAGRLAPLCPRARPLPAGLRDYPPAPHYCPPAPHHYPPEPYSPQNLALELCKSILYEHADSLDIAHLQSLNSASVGDDSLWNNKPQQYFESMNYAERPDGDCDADSLAH